MRILLACLPGLAFAAIGSAHAAALGPTTAQPARPSSAIITVEESQQRAGRDCTPTNGPFGFYGNIWCQPPNEQSYLRNLGSKWPMETPPSLKNPKPSTSNSSDW